MSVESSLSIGHMNSLPGAAVFPPTGPATTHVTHDLGTCRSPRTVFSTAAVNRRSIAFPSNQRSLWTGQLSASSMSSSSQKLMSSLTVARGGVNRRSRSSSLSGDDEIPLQSTARLRLSPSGSLTGKKVMNIASDSLAKARARSAQKENDAMVYLDGQQVYTCAHCRTHLTSHDDIVSKSFHGRHGRAYLFDHCVNVTIGKAEDRFLITGLHSVCDIFCKRCKTMVGWTYARAYEPSQKYKEKKFIIEKINLHMEESPSYDVIPPPAGEWPDRWRHRSMTWGTSEFSTPQYSEDRRMSDAVPHAIAEYDHSKPTPYLD